MKKICSKIVDNVFFEKFIIALIFINLMIFICQTDTALNFSFGHIFKNIEVFSIVIFTIEYFLRLFCLKNIKELFSFYMIVDFFAIFPYYLSFIKINTIFIRVIRLFRIFKIMKITRYSSAIKNIVLAFRKRKNELIITAGIFLVAVFLSATGIYYAEHNTNNPEFKSIISSLWWAIITFTTVGYGDAIPVTAWGRFISGISAIFGVGLHGLVIGVISSSIYEVINLSVNEENK